MRIFHNRPLAIAECIFALCAVGALFLEPRWKWLILCLSLLGALIIGVLSFFSRGTFCLSRRFLILMCLVAVSVSLLGNILFFECRYADVAAWEGKTMRVEGTVLQRLSSTAYSGSFEVELEVRDGEEEHTRVILETNYASALQIGDRFSASVTARPFKNEGSFDEARYRLADGILSVLVCDAPKNCEILPEQRETLTVLMRKWNLQLSSRLFHAIGGEEGALSAALLLGNRSFLSADTSLHFSRAGISHLLALSGLHVSILVALWEFLLRSVRMPRLLRAFLMPAALFGYLALTGFAPSTFRAVLMVGMLYLGFLLYGEYDSFTALCTVLTVILLITPYAVLDLSMWMSFLAAGAIVIFLPRFLSGGERAFPTGRIRRFLLLRGRQILGAIFVGIAANLALLLLLSYVYGEISLFSVPATLLLSLPTAMTLILSIPTLLFPLLPTSLLCRWSSGAMLAVARSFSDVEGALQPMTDTASRICLIVMTAVLILFAIVRVKRRVWWCLPLCLAILAFGIAWNATYRWENGISVTYVRAGEGSICLFSEDGKAVVVDCSNGREGGVDALAAAMQEVRCTEIQDLILTRYFNMQAYFVKTVSTEFRVQRLHLPVPISEEERQIAERLEQEAALHGVSILYGAEETAIKGLEILQYAHAAVEGTTQAAILFSVRAEGKTVTAINMATADSALAALAENLVWDTDVLIVNSGGWTKAGSGRFAYRSQKEMTMILEEEKLRDCLPIPFDDSRVFSSVERKRIFLKKDCCSGDEQQLFFIFC